MIPSIRLSELLHENGIPVIMGPTASGKSSLGLQLARFCGGEIISADSMQFYKGLNIGVAKPTLEEQGEVVHHFLDVMDISEKSDVYRFCNDAEHVIDEIFSRGKIPIIVGGSGLYLRGLMYGLDQLPVDQGLRDELNKEYDNDEGYPVLLEYMRRHCPEDARRFSADRRKLIRACEVFRLTGKQISELQTGTKNKKLRRNYNSFLLLWERNELCERIRRRTQEMLENGWIEEAEMMIKKGLLNTPSAWQALGYRIIGEYLEGKITREALTEQIVIATRQFARRQVTWFTHQHPEARIIRMPCVFTEA